MSLLNSLIPIAIDSEGRTYPNAYLYSYDVGTNTPKATYSDSGLSIPNANPLQADGSGRFFNVYLGTGGYKLVLRDEFDTVIWTQDNYYQALDGTDLANINADIAQVDQNLSQTLFIAQDSGVADAYVLSPAGVETAPTAYANGMIIAFAPFNNNTGASTVQVGSLPVKNLVNSDGSPLAANFLVNTSFYQFIYVSGQFFFFFKSGMVTTSIIEDLAVTTGKLAANAVTTAKITDKNVTLGKLADGTANKLIGYDSSGVATQWSNPMRLLDSGSFTAAASKQFVLSTLDANQSVDNCYLLRLVGFQPANDDKELYITISTDAGSTYVATNYYFSCGGTDSSGTAVASLSNNGAAAAQATILGGSVGTFALSNAADETAVLDLYLYNFNTGTSIRPYANGYGSFWAAAANDLVRQSVSFSQTAAGDYDAIKLTLESGGNFAAVGKYYIFKIPNVT